MNYSIQLCRKKYENYKYKKNIPFEIGLPINWDK